MLLRIMGALATAGLMCGAQAQEQSEWPTYHGGYNLDGVATAAPPDSPERLWRYKAGARIEEPPVAGGGRIYFTTAKSHLEAVDMGGRPIWKIEVADDSFSAPPLFADSLVVVGSTKGTLYAYDAATGKEKWTHKVGDYIQGTANRVDLPGGNKKGIVAISQTDGALHCVEIDTGKALWTTGPLERCDGSPGAANGRIILGSCASALHVFSVEKRAKTADIPLGGDSQVAGGVAVVENMAFAGTRNGSVCAVDVAGNKVVWTNRDSRRQAFTTPAVNGRFVIFGSDDGKVYALRRDTGAKVWDFDTGDKPSSPVIAGHRVVVSSGGSLFLLDLEKGGKVWTVRVSDEITSPAIVGGMVIVGADDGTITAFGRP